MIPKTFALPLLFSLIVVATAQAEVPLLRPAEQMELAKHIVTGQIQNVYTTEKARSKDYIDTLYALEVVISGVEKGEGIAPKQVIFVKAWQMKKRARGWAGQSGQVAIPQPGQTVKLFLTSHNGGYDALSPNGMAIVDKRPE